MNEQNNLFLRGCVNEYLISDVFGSSIDLSTKLKLPGSLNYDPQRETLGTIDRPMELFYPTRNFQVSASSKFLWACDQSKKGESVRYHHYLYSPENNTPIVGLMINAGEVSNIHDRMAVLHWTGLLDPIDAFRSMLFGKGWTTEVFAEASYLSEHTCAKLEDLLIQPDRENELPKGSAEFLKFIDSQFDADVERAFSIILRLEPLHINEFTDLMVEALNDKINGSIFGSSSRSSIVRKQAARISELSRARKILERRLSLAREKVSTSSISLSINCSGEFGTNHNYSLRIPLFQLGVIGTPIISATVQQQKVPVFAE